MLFNRIHTTVDFDVQLRTGTDSKASKARLSNSIQRADTTRDTNQRNERHNSRQQSAVLQPPIMNTTRIIKLQRSCMTRGTKIGMQNRCERTFSPDELPRR